MFAMLSRIADTTARTLALLGGFLLIIIIIFSCVSIIGRALFSAGICCGPIRGIYDYTEVAVGAAIFAFLPYCHLRHENASVDLFKSALPGGINRVINVVVDLGMLVIATVIAQRLYLGMLDKQNYGETTLIAQLPVWYGYALALVGAIGFALVAAFCLIRSVRQVIGIDPVSEEYQ